MKKLFILLVLVSVSFLMWNESTFPANEKSEIGALKVKIFDFKNEDRGGDKDKTTIEREINNFLSNNSKIEQIIQTSAGAGTNGYISFHTTITIFYRQ